MSRPDDVMGKPYCFDESRIRDLGVEDYKPFLCASDLLDAIQVWGGNSAVHVCSSAQHVKRPFDVPAGEGHTVGPRHAVAQFKCPRCPVRGQVPSGCKIVPEFEENVVMVVINVAPRARANQHVVEGVHGLERHAACLLPRIE